MSFTILAGTLQPHPEHAEEIARHEFETIHHSPSRYLPGHQTSHLGFGCPNCGQAIPLGGKQRIRCECELFIESCGDLLLVWTENGDPPRRPRMDTVSLNDLSHQSLKQALATASEHANEYSCLDAHSIMNALVHAEREREHRARAIRAHREGKA